MPRSEFCNIEQERSESILRLNIIHLLDISRYIARVFPMLSNDALEPTADLNWELSSR